MTTLTVFETSVLAAFINEGFDCNGSSTIEELRDDNMTWCNVDDLNNVTDLENKVLRGVMSSLEKKGLIVNSGESARQQHLRKCTKPDFYVSDEGLDYVEENFETVMG